MDSTAERVLVDLMQLEREIVELDQTLARDASERVQESLRRLAESRSPSDIIERSAGELSASTHLDQAVVGRIAAGTLTAIAVSGAGVDALPDFELGGVESAAIVADAAAIVDVRRHSSAGAMGWSECVLAPVLVGGEASALVYAGSPSGGRPLAEFDRELVERFAEGLGLALDHAVLEHAIARHRASLAALARELGWRHAAPTAAAAVRPLAAPDPPPSGDPLTARELEVLRLVAQGFTNVAIAERLSIGEGTVKYHLKNIMRKLRARSRADAVARHLHASALAR